jgi:hypothetical protein
MGARDRIPSDPAISRLEWSSEVRWRSLPELDNSTKAMEICKQQIDAFAREKL